ncbi:MAG: hypothetical protein ACLVMH_08530 [Christensenellales bacterium]
MAKKEKKKAGCLSRIFKVFSYFCVAIVILAFIGSVNRHSSEDTAAQDESNVQVEQTTSAEKTSAPKKTPEPTNTSKPTNTPKPTATPEPDTLQGWAEAVANSVYGSFDLKYSNLISVTCEQVDGESAPMIQLDVKYPDTFMRKNDDRMGSFLYNAKCANEKFADLAKEGKIEYGSVNIIAHTTYLDKYGNESDGMAASIRVKASEAAKVNWDIRNFTAEMMPGIAVSFGINPIIKEGLSVEYYAQIRNIRLE